MRNKFISIVVFQLFVLQAFTQSIQLTNLSPAVFCSTGKDTVKFSLNYTNIPQNSNIVFYQSANPAFNPYLGQGDSIGFINVGTNSSGGGGQVTTTCPEILGIFIDACDQGGTFREVDNEYMVITSGNAGFNVSDLKIQLPNTSINVSGCPFLTPSAATMTQLRNGTCDGTTLIAAGQSDFIPANAILIIFTGRGALFNYNFSSYCSSGQPIYILQNSCSPGTANFANNAPNSCPSNGYRATSVTVGSCTDKLTYFACSLPPFDNTNPNANDGNYVIHLPNTDTSSLTNGGIRNNAADKCNGLRFDSISGATIIKFPIPNDGSANPVTNFCNTGDHYIKAITNPSGSQPVSNTIQFKLICLDVTTNVSNLSFCSGSNALVNISSTDPNATFSWTVSGGAGITGASGGTGNTINQTLNYGGATKDSLIYTITATDGGCTKTTSVKVVVNKCSSCVAFNLGNDTTYCGPFTRILTTPNPNTVWSTGVTAASITVTAAGTYTATCGSFSDAITLTQTAGINFDFGANTTSVCVGGNISLDASTAYDSYLWSTGATTNAITITTPGKYWVDVFKNGCKGTDTITVIEIDKEPKPNIGADVAVCLPFSNTLTTGKANTTWLFNGTQVGTGASYTATQIGTYIARLSNSCGDVSDTVIITQTNTQAPINLGNDTSYCGAFSRVLSTGNSATVWSTGVTASSITVTQPGTYTATLNVGCGSVSDTIVLTAANGLVVNLGRDTTICTSNSLTLNATVPGNNITYLWNTGEQTPTIIVSAFGRYDVLVSNGNCAVRDTILVDVIDPPVIATIGSDTSFCGNFSFPLFTGDAGTIWSTGVVGPQITVTQPGRYIAENRNQCGSVKDTIVISQFALPSVNIGKDTTICDSIVLTTGTGNFLSILWNTGDTVPSIVVSKSGVYSVIVTNLNCSITDSVTINKECFYEVYIPTAFSPNGDGVNDVLVPLSFIKGMTVLEFLIFNRWGEKVFESNNFIPGDVTNGWKGTYKGENCQVDSYVFYFSVKMPDDKIKTYKGTFSLQR